jgi:hypothetical protein
MLLWLLAGAALDAGAARADIGLPLTVNGTLTIQAGSATTQMFTVGLVQAGADTRVITGSVLIRGGKGNGAACAAGSECWLTDYCEDNVCCCNAPGSTIVNGTSTPTCYQQQYANNSIYGNNNDPGSLYQCGNCAACNKTGSGTCAASINARSSARGSSTCRPAALAADGSTCDVAEACTCDGPTCPSSAQQCPADSFGNSGTVFASGWPAGQCRVPRGSCDVAGVCPGGTAVCPANQVRLASAYYVCAGQNTNGVCDGVTRCTGGVDCPAPLPAPAGTLCRASQGQCDVADRCDGVSTACNNVFIAANTVCDPSGVTCSGGSALCVNGSGASVGYTTSASCQ